MQDTPYVVGDRVIRHVLNFLKPEDSITRHGVVVERYAAKQSLSQTHWKEPDLYAVKWDDTGEVERGYFQDCLAREPRSSGDAGVP